MTDVAARPVSPGRIAVGVLRTMRPRQWVKNVVVLAAPFAAGQISHPAVLGAVLVAFVVFCLAAFGAPPIPAVLAAHRPTKLEY